ncbi:hypothetical protein J0H58_15435 [bacterium]|nr:hypothetical protein [bacterium]
MIASIPDLVAFLKRFHRHWLADPSLDPARIPADLPDGLATIYRELGKLAEIEGHRTPFGTQDSLVAVDGLRRINGMVTFAWENSGNWTARCPVGEPDPPVYSAARDVWDAPPRGYVVVCPSLNHFLTTLLLQEATLSCPHVAAVRDEMKPEQALAIPLRPLWLNGYYVSGEPDHSYYVSADEDVLVMEWFGLWVGSKSVPVSELVRPGVRQNFIS